MLYLSENTANRFTYSSEQYDQITQQYYLRARYYNPSVARFTQEDLYRNDGLNLYAYCANNPMMFVDPSGYIRRCADQQALDDLAEEAVRKAKSGNPISEDEALILDQWAKEYGVSQHHEVQPGSGAHFPGGGNQDHTHIYNKHVPYK